MAKSKIFRIAVIGISGIAVIFAVILFGAQEEESITIGAIISVTGPQGPTAEGTGIRDGMIIAAEEINKFGGINGAKINLVIENAETNTEKGREIFENMEKVYSPLLYVSTHSSVSNAIASLAEEAKVVQMATLASDPAITRDKEWVFRYWPTAGVEAPSIIAVLGEENIKSLGILYLDDEFGRAVSSLIKEGFEKTGGQASAKAFGIRDTDFTSSIRQFSEMDAIFSVGFPVHLKPIFKQIREAGYKGAVFSNLAAADASFHSLKEANGVFITAPVIYNPNSSFAEDLKGKYEARFEGTFTHYVATGYDTLKLLAGLLEDSDLTRENIKELLEAGFVHPGTLGTVSTNPGEHDISFPVYPAQILNGELKYRY
jgi:ABC-type branched-subunit amino acid transport system substrate-binding protein